MCSSPSVQLLPLPLPKATVDQKIPRAPDRALTYYPARDRHSDLGIRWFKPTIHVRNLNPKSEKSKLQT